MKTTTAVALALLSPITLAQSYFGVISARSASPIHLQELTARGGKFYLGGGPPSSYCPPQVGDACPSGNYTTFAGGDGTLSLAVVVPGGQQVYIAPDGSMSYTGPHSVYKPEGSIVDGWSKTEGENFGYLTFDQGLIACPPGNGTNGTTDTNGTYPGYQVFGQLPNITFTPGCLGFNALTSNTTEAGAWEY